MAYLLHLETATEVCSVAISDGATLLAIKESEAPYQHTAQITLLIQACLESAGIKMSAIDAVAVSEGPGSYTALRVGTATAKGVCYALQKKLISVSTLQSLALGAREEHTQADYYIAMIDARRMDVYCQIFDNSNIPHAGLQFLTLDEKSFHDFFSNEKKIVLCGNGAVKAQSLFPPHQLKVGPLKCSAKYLIPIAWKAFQASEYQDIAYYEPLYHKSPNITTPKRRLL